MARKNINDFLSNDRAVVRNLRQQGQSFSNSWDSFTSVSSKYTGGSHYNFSPRCYEGHKGLVLPGTKLKIYGGSCSTPKVTDADVYIGFDGMMRPTSRSFPWNEGHEILFSVPDMGTPKAVGEYKKLVDWTKEQLIAGKKVHAGCIGGHGRTGMFLAALVSMFGEKDAITYVRKHYCQKAVESMEQIKFLQKEFGVTIKEIAGSKSSRPNTYPGKQTYTKLDDPDPTPTISNGKRSFKPLTGSKGIWG